MDRERPWDPPALVDQLIGLAAGDAWQPIVEAGGSWCNCDFIIQAPNAWLDTEFRIESQNLDQVVTLQQKTLRDIGLMTIRSTDPAGGTGIVQTAGGIVSGILFSVRGRPGTKFMVSALQGAEPLAQAKCYLRVWGDESGNVRDREAVSIAHPFAEPHQQFNVSAEILAPGTTILVPVNPNGGRAYITGVSYFTTEAGALRAELETEEAITGTVTQRRQWLVGATAAPSFVETFSYPLRSNRGELYQLTLAGPVAGVHRINVTGYYD